ncbi:MAG: 2-oxoacid:ferredoxin oxidoreductase subunit beta [Dehalococcoidia bacterium]|nr:MAG: 2-oxoacid:ferredoxin oxidoreductase subunit beta [Dehalococcoidia bacterium]
MPEIVVESHPIDTVFRTERLPHIFCPGCGIGPAVHAYAQAILESGIPKERHACVSGIGCSARVPGYMDVDSYHTTHGRPIPFATAIAVVKPEMEVTVFSGDGDLFGIGGNHFIHAARRNVDINIICINNFNYGMTGGQVGPTTPLGAKASTAPYGNTEPAFNLPYLAAATGAVFVARWTALHVRQLKEAILRAMQKKGFTFIEVLAPCPVGFGSPNDLGDAIEEVWLYRERCVVDHSVYLPDLELDLRRKDKPFVMGNFVDIEKEPFDPLAMMKKKEGE